MPASESPHSHHVGNAAGVGRVQHDNLGGDVTLHRLSHLIHCAIDGWVIDLEPVVSIPADKEPDVLLPKEPLLVHLHVKEEECWVLVSFSFSCLISLDTVHPLGNQRRAEN